MARTSTLTVEMTGLPQVQAVLNATSQLTDTVAKALNDPALKGTRAESCLRAGLLEVQQSLAAARRSRLEVR